jgi:choline transport protein
MACNPNGDPFGWYDHNRCNNIEETSSPVGDPGRNSACVSIGAPHEIAGTMLTTSPNRLFFFIIMVAILATSQKASNADVWQTFINAGGWPNDGVSFCIGFLTPAFALAGVDSVVHMSEETHHASVNIPRAMIWSVVINGIAGFGFILTILYAITDIDEVLTIGGNTGYPIIGVFQQATSNPHAATAMLCAVIIVFAMALFGVQASTSRLTWAFARDRYVIF